MGVGVGVGVRRRLHVGVLLRPLLLRLQVVVVVVVAAGGLLVVPVVVLNDRLRLLLRLLSRPSRQRFVVVASRRAPLLVAAGLGGGARRRRGALASTRDAEEVCRGGGVRILGDMADVEPAAAEHQRRCGGGVDLHDWLALEHGLDGGLARVPLAGPEQADGAVDRVDDAAARLVEEGAEDGRAEVVLGVWRRGQQVEQPRAAVELGEEDGGVGLRLRGLDPLQAGPDRARVAAALAQDAAAVAAHPHVSRSSSASGR